MAAVLADDELTVFFVTLVNPTFRMGQEQVARFRGRGLSAELKVSGSAGIAVVDGYLEP